MRFVRRHPLVSAVLAIVVVATSALVATGVAVWRAAHNDEARVVGRTDTILVLGAAQYGGEPSPVFRQRLDHAVLLYQRGFSDDIVVLGAGRPGDVTTEAQAGASYLVAQGVPDEDVLASPQGTSTYESLRAAAHLMEHRGWQSAFLVSDPWHNLRIRRMARDLGIEGYVSATFQSAARSRGVRMLGYVREVFAYLAYRVLGR